MISLGAGTDTDEEHVRETVQEAAKDMDENGDTKMAGESEHEAEQSKLCQIMRRANCRVSTGYRRELGDDEDEQFGASSKLRQQSHGDGYVSSVASDYLNVLPRKCLVYLMSCRGNDLYILIH
jgi:hypothetical protein